MVVLEDEFGLLHCGAGGVIDSHEEPVSFFFFFSYVTMYLLLNNCINMGVRYVLTMSLEFPIPL